MDLFNKTKLADMTLDRDELWDRVQDMRCSIDLMEEQHKKQVQIIESEKQQLKDANRNHKSTIKSLKAENKETLGRIIEVKKLMDNAYDMLNGEEEVNESIQLVVGRDEEGAVMIEEIYINDPAPDCVFDKIAHEFTERMINHYGCHEAIIDYQIIDRNYWQATFTYEVVDSNGDFNMNDMFVYIKTPQRCNVGLHHKGMKMADYAAEVHNIWSVKQ